MKDIDKLINMDELFQYSYLKEEKMFQFKTGLKYSNVYQIKEMLEIVSILEDKNITYIVDINKNIILNNL